MAPLLRGAINVPVFLSNVTVRLLYSPPLGGDFILSMEMLFGTIYTQSIRDKSKPSFNGKAIGRNLSGVADTCHGTLSIS